MVTGVQTVKPQYTEDGRAFILASPISITSPSNVTYSSNKLNLGVNFKLLLDPKYAEVNYSLDGKENTTIQLTGTKIPIEATRTYANGTTRVINSTSFMVPFTVTGVVPLPELSHGPHNITVYARYTANNIIGLDTKTVYFTINNSNLKQNIQTISESPEWTPLLVVVFIVIVMAILYKYILNKLDT